MLEINDTTSSFFYKAYQEGSKEEVSQMLARLRDNYAHVFLVYGDKDLEPSEDFYGNLVPMLLRIWQPKAKVATIKNLESVYDPKGYNHGWGGHVALVVFDKYDQPEIPLEIMVMVDDMVEKGATVFVFPPSHKWDHLLRRFAALGK